MSIAEKKYAEALKLYAETELSLTDIASQCGVTRRALSAYISRNHRDMMLKRNGLEDFADKKRTNKGQRPETREKYREAIEACDSNDYINLNVSQIARKFGLSGSALANQLRAHYPEIIPRREKERQRLGIADNTPRGARKESQCEYADALELLRNSDLTIEAAAKKCGVSFSGLRQYLQFYAKDVAKERDTRKLEEREKRKIEMESIKAPEKYKRKRYSKESADKYAEAIKLYQESHESLKSIASKFGILYPSLTSYLRRNHPCL